MRLALIPAVLPFLMTTALLAEPLNVKLTVRERLGVGRVNEPVTSGVPLPRGAVNDVGELSLYNAAGEPVPAQFSVATRWHPDPSIKWVHVDFAASVPPNGTAVYSLRTGAAAAKIESPIKVTQTAAGVEVDTGPLKFAVHGDDSLRLFDSAELNGKPILRTGMTSMKFPGNVFGHGTRKVSVEDQGPLKVVLLVTGRYDVCAVLKDGEQPPAQAKALDYKIRIYAYAGSPLVRVTYTVENRRGKWDDHVDIADWFLSLGVHRGDGPVRYRFGLADRPVSGSLTEDAQARLDVIATDRYEFSGQARGDGDPFREDPPWIGTLDVSGPEGGVTVGVRNFWQMWSKYLSADGNGQLKVGLWTDRVRDKGITTFVDAEGNAQFFAGVARTHELWFNFHAGTGAADGPARRRDPLHAVAAAREPLFAACEPAWYCQATKAFGDLSEADLNAYAPEWRDRVAALNAWAEQSVKKPLQRWRTVRAGVNGAVDSFGMLSYGDGVEEQNDGTAPTRIHWEGGYYDYPHSIYLNFARTADPFYLWLATDMSSHNADVHHTHHDTEGGRSRYCPSWGHIIMDSHGGPYASGTFNHWKNLSAFERWYLTGDHRAREAAMEITGFAMRLGNGGIDFGQPRSICHGLLGFWAGYEATGEQKYLDQMARFAKAVAARIDKGQKMGSGGWQRGMALQGMCWYVEQSGDESVVPAITAALERDFNDNTGELAYASAFLWKRTGEERYFHKAVRHLGGRADIWMQRFGNYGRSKLYVPTLVRADAPRTPPATK